MKYWKIEGYQKYADGNVWEVPVARRFEFEKSDTAFAEKNLIVQLAEFFKTATAAQTVSGENVQNMLPGIYSPNFPTVKTFKDGHWTNGNPPAEYRGIWELALRVNRLIESVKDRTEAEKEALPSMESDEAKNTAIKVLQIWYNIGVAEASWLEMMTDSDFSKVLMRFCGYDLYDSWCQKKMHEAIWTMLEGGNSTQTEPETSSNGSTETTPVTLPA